jgi:DNA-binding beta-propeller fold protein YncE
MKAKPRSSFIALGTLIALPFLVARLAPAAAAPPNDRPLNRVGGLAVDLRTGALYVADPGRSAILHVDARGGITPFAGTEVPGFNGDGRRALETQFSGPTAVSLDPRTGELFVADTRNYRVRAISPDDGRVRTIAGIGVSGVSPRQIPYELHTPEALAIGHFAGDGGPAEKAELNLPTGVCADPFGILFIADSGNHRVRAVNRGTSPVFMMGVEIEPGAIRTIAGTGTLGFSGDGEQATHAQLALPAELKVDAAGNLLVVDTFNHRLRKIDRQSGIIHTVARGNVPAMPAQTALVLWSASILGVSITPTQDLVYTDRVDRSVHLLTRGGDTRVLYKASGLEAEIADVELGPAGAIYVADVKHQRVLRVDGGSARTFVAGMVQTTSLR